MRSNFILTLVTTVLIQSCTIEVHDHFIKRTSGVRAVTIDSKAIAESFNLGEDYQLELDLVRDSIYEMLVDDPRFENVQAESLDYGFIISLAIPRNEIGGVYRATEDTSASDALYQFKEGGVLIEFGQDQKMAMLNKSEREARELNQEMTNDAFDLRYKVTFDFEVEVNSMEHFKEIEPNVFEYSSEIEGLNANAVLDLKFKE